MESAFSLAVQDLKNIRESNNAEHRKRLEEVRLKAPQYAETEAALMRCGTALARCVLSDGKNYEAVKAAIQKLHEEKTEILSSLNLPSDYLDDIYTCQNCHDTGYDQNGRKCSCLEQRISVHSGIGSNLTEYMHEQTFDNFDFSLFANQPDENGRQPLAYVKHAYKSCLSFAETFDTSHANLLLTGKTGTGKTYLSSCIANYALKRSKTVLYQTAFQMFEALENLKFSRFNENEAESLQFLRSRIYNADLLIIDDLGTEFISAYSAAVLFDIVNTRLLRGLSTILSTNLNSDELKEVYSSRLLSRLWENFMILPFIGQNLRTQKRRNNGGKND